MIPLMPNNHNTYNQQSIHETKDLNILTPHCVAVVKCIATQLQAENQFVQKTIPLRRSDKKDCVALSTQNTKSSLVLCPQKRKSINSPLVLRLRKLHKHGKILPNYS
jgi:hypothetical protein